VEDKRGGCPLFLYAKKSKEKEGRFSFKNNQVNTSFKRGIKKVKKKRVDLVLKIIK